MPRKRPRRTLLCPKRPPETPQTTQPPLRPLAALQGPSSSKLMELMGQSFKIMKFRFDEAAHQYWVGDMRIPGTTEVLRGLGVIDGRWTQERDLIRGSAVHLACKFLAENRPDREST